MNKTAKSYAGARALEGMIGAVLGGGVGAAGGHLSYKPVSPLEWMDEKGDVWSRNMTEDEKKARAALRAKAALIGALGGAALSIGGAQLRLKQLAKADVEAAEGAVNQYMDPIREVLDDYAATASRLGNRSPKSAPAKKAKRELNAAQKIYDGHLKAIDDLAEQAKTERAQEAFGGWTKSKVRSQRDPKKVLQNTPWSNLTLTGKVHGHFYEWAKKNGFGQAQAGPLGRVEKGITPWNPDQVMRAAVAGMTKKAFARELALILDGPNMEKVAIRETGRIGLKALKQALLGGTELKAAPGVFQAQREKAVGAGTKLMDALKARGITTHRARVKTPESITAKGLTEVPDDLLGMQTYARSPEEVQSLMNALKAEGVTGLSASAKTRPGYHGVNIKGSYEGTPIEFQASPSRVSNMGQIMEHSLGYKQKTEAPLANRFDKWVGREVAPRMVNWDTLGRRMDPSWVNENLQRLRGMGVQT